MKTWVFFIAAFAWFVLPASAQDEIPHGKVATHPEHHDFRHFRIAPLIGHTFIPTRHGSEHFAIPSYGLDLEYWFHPNWGIGLHNDLELQTFIIDQPGEEALEREYPFVMTLDVLWKPWKGLVLQAGPGYEFERTENLKLLRFGVEYEFEIARHWDISPSVFYDTRQHAFDTWSIALGVGKRF